ncbi:UDP-N-acetylmuramate dehydrogenase [Aestuariibacter sp. GS-14]|uniref:UDP-N-acetylmuramate dehydrogenase n=1 Tax=Aestuariibacter sp. GS-14 TaxID=2590670 RepID=UPI00112D8EF9|nr:UDP-N-acetylmuramate dehydrogenase [Aestuariibacter sp. GS-14]TPV58296.1 UDP-N-acetylmuramate dehydrogenase [Aestuariibacter sp. GS-14]
MPELTHRHTFALPSHCKQLKSFASVASLLAAYRTDMPVYILGGGSNSIFIDDFEGLVLVNDIKGIDVQHDEEGVRLTVGGGENWHDLVTYTVEQGWHGLENLALIPGSVGAAPIQNIGAYGLEVGERIEKVDVVVLDTGEQFSLSQQACEFGYRDSVFKRPEHNKWIVTHVHFFLPHNAVPITRYAELDALINPTAKDIFNTVIAVRQRKLPDPKLLGNAGSFFKNPVISKQHYTELCGRYGTVPGFEVDAANVKVPAAWLIDNAGFKGQCRDGVCSYQHQPLVLVNQSATSGLAVVAFAREIIDTVYTRFGVQLEPEVRLVGKTGLVTL